MKTRRQPSGILRKSPHISPIGRGHSMSLRSKVSKFTMRSSNSDGGGRSILGALRFKVLKQF